MSFCGSDCREKPQRMRCLLGCTAFSWSYTINSASDDRQHDSGGENKFFFSFMARQQTTRTDRKRNISGAVIGISPRASVTEYGEALYLSGTQHCMIPGVCLVLVFYYFMFESSARTGSVQEGGLSWQLGQILGVRRNSNNFCSISDTGEAGAPRVVPYEV